MFDREIFIRYIPNHTMSLKKRKGRHRVSGWNSLAINLIVINQRRILGGPTFDSYYIIIGESGNQIIIIFFPPIGIDLAALVRQKSCN
jgi:hypothetical protein